MSDTNTAAAGFNGLVDLASALVGGKALATSDDFFAGMDNLLLPARAVFIAGKFTERGKWMDGWESRRKRGPGHDWCLLELGVPGSVLAFDIDTQHFNGNHPAFASVDGISAPRGTPLPELLNGNFQELLPQMPLLPSSQNLFVASPSPVVSHLRLNIFPDGGRGALAGLRQSVGGLGHTRAGFAGRGARTARLLRLGRARERRARAGLLGRAFRRHEQPALARPRREHGLGVGDAPAPCSGQ